MLLAFLVNPSKSCDQSISIGQTEDNELVIEGLGLIETLVSSETSSNVSTLTTFKTTLLTTVFMNMVCTYDKTLSLCELMLHVYFRIC